MTPPLPPRPAPHCAKTRARSGWMSTRLTAQWHGTGLRHRPVARSRAETSAKAVSGVTSVGSQWVVMAPQRGAVQGFTRLFNPGKAIYTGPRRIRKKNTREGWRKLVYGGQILERTGAEGAKISGNTPSSGLLQASPKIGAEPMKYAPNPAQDRMISDDSFGQCRVTDQMS